MKVIKIKIVIREMARRQGRKLYLLLSVLVLFAICQSAVFAQTAITGSINGTVVDSTGAVVPNATVTVKDTTTNATLNLTSNAEGRFTAPFLKPDVFNVSATAPGLQSTTTSVQILTGQIAQVNLTVTPTANTQTVQVSANSTQLIDTQSANLSTTFTTAQFRDRTSRRRTGLVGLHGHLAVQRQESHA